ncbi:Putative outer membrane protein assembly factor BamC [Buchnera aphidicola (Protaphis terricola)]
MPMFKKNIFFFKNKIIILQLFFIFSLTSCNLNSSPKNYNILFNKNNLHQFKKLIIPKDINFPHENPEYKIPYTKKDINRENINIFPPI